MQGLRWVAVLAFSLIVISNFSSSCWLITKTVPAKLLNWLMIKWPCQKNNYVVPLVERDDLIYMDNIIIVLVFPVVSYHYGVFL